MTNILAKKFSFIKTFNLFNDFSEFKEIRMNNELFKSDSSDFFHLHFNLKKV